MFDVAVSFRCHIVTTQKPVTGMKFPSLHEQFKGVLQLQKYHRQPSTTPHVYIATRLTH